jgi:sec-independent protein translocase protein TatC
MVNSELPIFQHLKELRQRLINSVIAILVCFVVLALFANDIYHFIATPLLGVLPEGANMIATGVAAPVLTPFKLAFMLALILAVPIILHQVWAFVSPGLYAHEKRFAVPVLLLSIILFYSGIAFAYFIIFPIVFAFFTSMAPEGIVIATDISSYLDFILKLFIAFGIAFEVPIAVLILCWSGISTREKLKDKRPYIIVGAFILGMLLTPPDVISQTLLALPMWMLFELGLILAKFVEKSPNAAGESGAK